MANDDEGPAQVQDQTGPVLAEHVAQLVSRWPDCIPFIGGGRSGEKFVQQLLEGIFSRPPGCRRSVEIDR